MRLVILVMSVCKLTNERTVATVAKVDICTYVPMYCSYTATVKKMVRLFCTFRVPRQSRTCYKHQMAMTLHAAPSPSNSIDAHAYVYYKSAVLVQNVLMAMQCRACEHS